MMIPNIVCNVCGARFFPPQQPGCDRNDCPPNVELHINGQKLMGTLLDVTQRWANGTSVDTRIIALAYGGAAGACFLLLSEEDRIRIVQRMCAVLIATTDVPLVVHDADSPYMPPDPLRGRPQ